MTDVLTAHDIHHRFHEKVTQSRFDPNQCSYSGAQPLSDANKEHRHERPIQPPNLVRQNALARRRCHRDRRRFTRVAAHAQSEPLIGQILWTAATFCPRSYVEADGQLLSIVQNTALFALIGTQSGGNGQTTFAVPDLRGRSAVHTGAGPGLDPLQQGDRGGVERRSLTVSELPSHRHALNASTGDAISGNPANGVLAAPQAATTTSATATGTVNGDTGGGGGNGRGNGGGGNRSSTVDIALDVDVAVDVATYDSPGTANVAMAAESIGITGGNQPIDIRSPYLTLRACIAVVGIFPSRP